MIIIKKQNYTPREINFSKNDCNITLFTSASHGGVWLMHLIDVLIWLINQLQSEKNYLLKSYQHAIVKKDLAAGGMVGLSDLIFRRTDQSGLKWSEIVSMQSQGNVLSKNITEGSCITKNDFNKAKVGVIIACRMKSSRLKNKAVLPINGLTSVERCIQSCEKIHSADEIILATSTLDEDLVLKNHTLDHTAKFFQGDPEDVIKRYIDACDKFKVDVIIRVTADCPVVSAEISEILLKSHFEAGADYTAAKSCSVGSSVEIYNTEALRRVILLMGNAKHSEYMTWYMQNNSDIFKLNIIDLPIDLQRDYRLTLDYPEDLEMFNQLFNELGGKNLDPNIRNVFKVLDENLSIPMLNQHLTLSYKTDQKLIEKLNKETKI